MMSGRGALTCLWVVDGWQVWWPSVLALKLQRLVLCKPGILDGSWWSDEELVDGLPRQGDDRLGDGQVHWRAGEIVADE